MIDTIYIHCDTCKKKMWYGQTGKTKERESYAYCYHEEKTYQLLVEKMEKMEKFLLDRHKDCSENDISECLKIIEEIEKENK